MTTQNDDPIIGLYRECFPDFARMIRRMGGNLEQAKDSFHDALLIYLEKEKAGALCLHASPKAYLLGTARICWLRSQNSNPPLPLPEGFEPADPQDSDTEETERTLLASLQKSGKKCLELLRAFYYDHRSMQDIAERFGFKGRRSATVQKYKCLEKVREEIKTSLCAVN
ncbi:MAG TPA: sigma-70 family RNA polymerase sigma factor [Puia sp.]|nr:sigma-70 family RNA polymerase sigma factor [Puia sp.]